MSLSRRTVLASSTALAASTVISGCGPKSAAPIETATPTGPDPLAAANEILGRAKDLLITAYPETASSYGIDNGDNAGLKSKLTDRSAAGQAKIESDVRTLTAELAAVDTSALPDSDALNIQVVHRVFETATEGFDFKFGDNAILNANWSWRPTPYVVAQNVGAFVEIPSFLDSSHAIETGDDVEAYLARLEAYAGQLDGETERTRAAGEKGYIIPDFLLERTIGQLSGALAKDPAEWGLVTRMAGADITALTADAHSRAEAIARDKIAPAIARQVEVHQALVPKATSDAGVWAKPHGAEYYAWALGAATTTNMSPDEVHEMGKEELASLQARMEPILQSIGYTAGHSRRAYERAWRRSALCLFGR